jgi:uncharacterized protein (TIGR03435 family)
LNCGEEIGIDRLLDESGKRPKENLPMKMFPLALASASLLMAQAPAQKKLEYEVVSVKPHLDNDFRIMINLGQGDGGRLNLSGVPIALLIQLAYTSGAMGGPLGSNANLTGLSGWAQTDRFDIEGRPEAGFRPTIEQTREMIRSLLEDRFALKLHKETKDGPVFALVVAKDGPKMKLSADQTPLAPPGAPPRGDGARAPDGSVPPPPPPPPGPNFNPQTATLNSMPRGMMMNGPGLLRGTSQNMASLARLLSNPAGRQVIDKTGLTGLYDVELKFAPTGPPAGLPGVPLPPGVTLPEADPSAPSIFTAVQEQLGLKLESSKAPIESIVVEHVEKPTAN